MYPFFSIDFRKQRLFSLHSTVIHICHKKENALDQPVVLTTIAEDLTCMHYFPHPSEVLEVSSRNLPFMLHYFSKFSFLVTQSANKPSIAFEGMKVNISSNCYKTLTRHTTVLFHFSTDSMPGQDMNLVSLKRILHFTRKKSFQVSSPFPKLRMKMFQNYFYSGTQLLVVCVCSGI